MNYPHLSLFVKRVTHSQSQDYLDVLNVLKGKPFVYFTSDKSSIIELCEWLGKNKTLGNPFEGCERFEFNAHVNYDAGYKDMMLVKPNAA